MIGTKNIEQALNIVPTISTKMSTAIELWDKMYKNEADWLHEPTYIDPTRVVSLGLPALISSEKARMATLEMKIVVTPSGEVPKDDDMQVDDNTPTATRAAFINKMFQLHLMPHIRRQLEYGIAKGGLVIKPYIYRDNQIAFAFCQADDFYPLTFDSVGNITEAAFVDTVSQEKIIYTRLEYHKFDAQTRTVTVINKAYKQYINQDMDRNKNTLGIEIDLHSIDAWKNIATEATIQNVDRLLFAYFKMPDANTIDSLSPLGVSGFSRAVSLIRDADYQYSELLWEYEGGQLAVDVDLDALKTTKDASGNYIELPNKLQSRLFRKLDLNTEETYQQYAPTLRDASYNNGLNAIFMRVEDACSLSRGTISDITRSEAKTATELLIMRQRSYAANADIQKALQRTLDDVIYIINVYCDLYNLAPAGEYSVSYTWDDSLINSPEEELQRRLLLMNAGIESRLNIRMWYYGETEDQAKKALEVSTQEAKERADTLTPQPQPGLNTTGSKTPKSPEDTKKNINKPEDNK